MPVRPYVSVGTVMADDDDDDDDDDDVRRVTDRTTTNAQLQMP